MADILILGDDLLSAVAVRATLESAEHSVDLRDQTATTQGLTTDPYQLAVLSIKTSDTVEMLGLLRAGDARIPILVMSTSAAEEKVVQALRAGADDYIRIPFGYHELIARVEVLLRRSGSTRHDQPAEVASSIGGTSTPAQLWSAGESQLTPREAEVASLVMKGLSNKAIATRLGISLATVKGHVHSILQKQQCRTRWQISDRV